MQKSAKELPIVHKQFGIRRWQVTGTYALLGIENGLDLLYPLLIGIGINGTLNGDFYSLVPLAAVWLTHICIGAVRQIVDTRIFSAIHVAVAGELANRIDEGDSELSRVSAHISMSQDVVDFYEFDVPAIVETIIGLIGAIALMFYFDVIAGLLVLALMVPATIMNKWLGKRSLRLNRLLNNQHERQVDILSRRHRRSAPFHFARVRRFRISLSNAEAASWSMVEVVTLVVSMFVIVRLASLPDATAGSIFAGVAYLLRIIDELDRVPELIQKIARLADIRRRLAEG